MKETADDRKDDFPKRRPPTGHRNSFSQRKHNLNKNLNQNNESSNSNSGKLDVKYSIFGKLFKMFIIF